MTGFPTARQARTIIFCMFVTSSTGISTPKSPRATMMPSATAKISSKFCRPSVVVVCVCIDRSWSTRVLWMDRNTTPIRSSAHPRAEREASPVRPVRTRALDLGDDLRGRVAGGPELGHLLRQVGADVVDVLRLPHEGCRHEVDVPVCCCRAGAGLGSDLRHTPRASPSSTAGQLAHPRTHFCTPKRRSALSLGVSAGRSTLLLGTFTPRRFLIRPEFRALHRTPFPSPTLAITSCRPRPKTKQIKSDVRQCTVDRHNTQAWRGS